MGIHPRNSNRGCGVGPVAVRDIIHDMKFCLPRLRVLAHRGISIVRLLEIVETWPCQCPGLSVCLDRSKQPAGWPVQAQNRCTKVEWRG